MNLGNIKISPVDLESRKNFDGKPGDTVRVSVKIKEGNKVRTQDFEGLILTRKHGSEAGATFTVRKVASGVGVERTFPLYSPNIEKIEIKKRGKARRAKLYFIHDKASKEIRKKLRSQVLKKSIVTEDAKIEEPVVEAEVAAE